MNELYNYFEVTLHGFLQGRAISKIPFPVSCLQQLGIKVSLKLSEKNMSYRFARIIYEGFRSLRVLDYKVRKNGLKSVTRITKCDKVDYKFR